MTNGLSLWRQRLWLWLVPLLFVGANAGLLSMYQAGYAGRVGLLEQASDRRVEILASLEQDRKTLEDRLQFVEDSRGGIEALYHERLSTERQRLTRVIREVKDLARRAGLEPSRISYPEEPIQRYSLVRRSFVFRVTGDYRSLRKLINLLELTETFLVLEQIGVNRAAGKNPRLRISLHLSTLFVQDNEAEDYLLESTEAGSAISPILEEDSIDIPEEEAET